MLRFTLEYRDHPSGAAPSLIVTSLNTRQTVVVVALTITSTATAFQ